MKVSLLATLALATILATVAWDLPPWVVVASIGMALGLALLPAGKSTASQFKIGEPLQGRRQFEYAAFGPNTPWVIALVEGLHGLSRRGWSDLASRVALLDSHEGVEGLRLAIRSSNRAHASVHALQAQRWVEDEVNKLGSRHPDHTFRVRAVGAQIEPTLLRRRLAAAVGRVGAALIVIDEIAPVDFGELYVTLADPLPFDDLTARAHDLQRLHANAERNVAAVQSVLNALRNGDREAVTAALDVHPITATWYDRTEEFDLSSVKAIYECKCSPEIHEGEGREYIFVAHDGRWLKYTDRYVAVRESGAEIRWSGFRSIWTEDRRRLADRH